MKKTITMFFIFFIFFSFNVYAEEKINEEELFPSPDLIIETDKNKNANIAAADNKSDAEEKKTVDFTGEIIGSSNYMTRRNKNIEFDSLTPALTSSVLSKFFLDARLKKGTKYFADLEILSNSLTEGNDLDFVLSFKESFIDFNVKNAVYFRTGKQVIQWGRCYLWNPSDVINVEKLSFIKKLGSREGTYGMKIHVPFGVKYNIYGFIDTNNAKDTDELGFAGKYEFIFGNTEMAFSGWNKKGYPPAYAYDFSTRLFGIDIFGETAFLYGDNKEKIKNENGVLSSYKEKDKWIPKASIDFGKKFDFMEVNDRISVNLEFYYNQTGYTENILKDKTIYNFSQLNMNGTKKDFLLSNELYEQNNLSKYYAALFTNINKFIISDMTLSINSINNLIDNSGILTTGVKYKDINDFSLGFNIYSYFGKPDTEYTFSNIALTTQITVGIVF